MEKCYMSCGAESLGTDPHHRIMTEKNPSLIVTSHNSNHEQGFPLPLLAVAKGDTIMLADATAPPPTPIVEQAELQEKNKEKKTSSLVLPPIVCVDVNAIQSRHSARKQLPIIQRTRKPVDHFNYRKQLNDVSPKQRSRLPLLQANYTKTSVKSHRTINYERQPPPMQRRHYYSQQTGIRPVMSARATLALLSSIDFKELRESFLNRNHSNGRCGSKQPIDKTRTAAGESSNQNKCSSKDSIQKASKKKAGSSHKLPRRAILKPQYSSLLIEGLSIKNPYQQVAAGSIHRSSSEVALPTYQQAADSDNNQLTITGHSKLERQRSISLVNLNQVVIDFNPLRPKLLSNEKANNTKMKNGVRLHPLKNADHLKRDMIDWSIVKPNQVSVYATSPLPPLVKNNFYKPKLTHVKNPMMDGFLVRKRKASESIEFPNLLPPNATSYSNTSSSYVNRSTHVRLGNKSKIADYSFKVPNRYPDLSVSGEHIQSYSDLSQMVGNVIQSAFYTVSAMIENSKERLQKLRQQRKERRKRRRELRKLAGLSTESSTDSEDYSDDDDSMDALLSDSDPNLSLLDKGTAASKRKSRRRRNRQRIKQMARMLGGSCGGGDGGTADDVKQQLRKKRLIEKLRKKGINVVSDEEAEKIIMLAMADMSQLEILELMEDESTTKRRRRKDEKDKRRRRRHEEGGDEVDDRSDSRRDRRRRRHHRRKQRQTRVIIVDGEEVVVSVSGDDYDNDDDLGEDGRGSRRHRRRGRDKRRHHRRRRRKGSDGLSEEDSYDDRRSGGRRGKRRKGRSRHHRRLRRRNGRGPNGTEGSDDSEFTESSGEYLSEDYYSSDDSYGSSEEWDSSASSYTDDYSSSWYSDTDDYSDSSEGSDGSGGKKKKKKKGGGHRRRAARHRRRRRSGSGDYEESVYSTEYDDDGNKIKGGSHRRRRRRRGGARHDSLSDGDEGSHSRRKRNRRRHRNKKRRGSSTSSDKDLKFSKQQTAGGIKNETELDMATEGRVDNMLEISRPNSTVAKPPTRSIRTQSGRLITTTQRVILGSNDHDRYSNTFMTETHGVLLEEDGYYHSEQLNEEERKLLRQRMLEESLLNDFDKEEAEMRRTRAIQKEAKMKAQLEMSERKRQEERSMEEAYVRKKMEKQLMAKQLEKLKIEIENRRAFHLYQRAVVDEYYECIEKWDSVEYAIIESHFGSEYRERIFNIDKERKLAEAIAMEKFFMENFELKRQELLIKLKFAHETFLEELASEILGLDGNAKISRAFVTSYYSILDSNVCIDSLV